MIVRVSVVLRRTVCDDTDWRFDNLSGSHHQSQVNCESSVDVVRLWSLSWLANVLIMLLVVCQLSRDVIGIEDCKTWLVRFDPSFVSQMPVGLLLVKLVSLSIVWFQKISIPFPRKGLEFPGGWGGVKGPGKSWGAGSVVSIYIIFSRPVPLFLYVKFSLFAFCLPIRGRKHWLRWSGSISGAARVRSFYQTAAD